MEADNTKKSDTQNAFAYVEKKSREEGRIEEKRNIAREFKKLGVPIADIAKGTTGCNPCRRC